MSIGSGEIICYGSKYMAESGVGIAGGAIENRTLVYFSNSSLINNIDNNSPSPHIYVTAPGGFIVKTFLYGKSKDGISVSGFFLETGSGTLLYDVVFDSIEKIHSYRMDNIYTDLNKRPSNFPIYVHSVLPGSSIYDSTLLFSVPSGIWEVRRPFYNISPNNDYYEKVFIRNNNSVESLLDVGFSDNGGDPNNYITFALENQLNASGYIANRNTAPNPAILGNSGFSASTKSMYDEIGTYDLPPSGAIGLWFKISLPSNAGPENSIWSLKINGDN